jgi:NADPH:quinone reductase-like Zn-dependent oxidoreductase
MDLPQPSPRKGEVLVRIVAAGVNPLDWKIADGFYDGRRAHVFPLVLGVDGSGTVEAVGTGVVRFRPGDRIFGQFLDDPVGIGTFAEFATVPESIGVSHFPSDFDPVEAAAVPTAGMTALTALDRLELGTGSTLLVVGASGGVGSFATQLAAARGIHVVAAGRAASADRLRLLGAREFVDVSPDGLVDRVRGLHPRGVDGVLDLMSDRSRFARVASLVRPGGRAATTVHAADTEAALTNGALVFNVDLTPSSTLLDRVLQEMMARRLRVPVERRIPLSDAPVALEESRSGRAAGKTVIVVAPT